MAKDPAFLFYSGDFVCGTLTMSDKQVGQYIRLMCLQHQQGHLSEEKMLSICRKHDPDIWSKFVRDENGLYYNLRLDEEISKRNNYCNSRRKNRENANICGTHDNTYVPHMGNENIDIDISLKEDKKKDKGCGEKGKEKIDGFDTFWGAYPRKVGKEAARKAFAKVSSHLPLMLEALGHQKQSEQWKKDRGQYIPNPATWLNQGRWEDELPQPKAFIYNDHYEEGDSL